MGVEVHMLLVLLAATLLLVCILSWTSRWILTILAQTHYWEGGKNWLDFGDLELIFKVTPALWNFKKLVCTQFLEANDGFWPNFYMYIVTLGWFTFCVMRYLTWSISPAAGLFFSNITSFSYFLECRNPDFFHFPTPSFCRTVPSELMFTSVGVDYLAKTHY